MQKWDFETKAFSFLVIYLSAAALSLITLSDMLTRSNINENFARRAYATKWWQVLRPKIEPILKSISLHELFMHATVLFIKEMAQNITRHTSHIHSALQDSFPGNNNTVILLSSKSNLLLPI